MKFLKYCGWMSLAAFISAIYVGFGAVALAMLIQGGDDVWVRLLGAGFLALEFLILCAIVRADYIEWEG